MHIKPWFYHSVLNQGLEFAKGGSKVRVLGQGGACNSVPNGPNDLKFCMQGAFVCYYWVLVHSSSCNLYNGQACSGLQMWLAAIEVTWPWLDQKSIVTHPCMQNFKKFRSLGVCWVTGTPLWKETGLCSPPLFYEVNNMNQSLSFIRVEELVKSFSL